MLLSVSQPVAVELGDADQVTRYMSESAAAAISVMSLHCPMLTRVTGSAVEPMTRDSSILRSTTKKRRFPEMAGMLLIRSGRVRQFTVRHTSDPGEAEDRRELVGGQLLGRRRSGRGRFRSGRRGVGRKRWPGRRGTGCQISFTAKIAQANAATAAIWRYGRRRPT